MLRCALTNFLRRTRRHHGYNYDHCQVTITTPRKIAVSTIRIEIDLVYRSKFSSDLEVFSKRLTHSKIDCVQFGRRCYCARADRQKRENYD